ncbi:hypothetical protein [Rhodoferax sp.]|uniref:RCC1 domain-containing protein n=1 Tax=Rhodoferax sp. TaxID=50421 RepID=UPI0025EA99AF|nr:hypothetical protein [Rhodoferax sp.]
MLNRTNGWMPRWLLVGFVALVCFASQAATPMVSLGRNHTVALQSDGRVLTWGDDGSGQLGTGRLPFSTVPGLVANLDSVKSIAAGVNHSLAVRQDGTVWAWGENSGGQLGGGESNNRTNATQVPEISNVISVCGGSAFSLALKSDATVWTWGSGHDGALGNGGFESASTPVQVSGLSQVAAIACGNSHALALKQDGSVWSWGSNADGELGDGSTTVRPTPVKVQGLSGVTSVSAGNFFSAALKADGTVWEWGVRDGYAKPHGTPRVLPMQTVGLSNVVALAASLNSFWLIALHADQKTWWNWQTGTPPVKKEPAGPIKSVSYAYGQFLLLKPDGTVLAGGGGGFGSLGDGTTNYRDEPGLVPSLPKIDQVATGDWHGLALDASGKVWSWGMDISGQLGHGRILGRSVPTVVAGLSDIVGLDAGGFHTHAVDRAGNVWVWGDNGSSQFGNGSYLSSSTPLRLDSIDEVQSLASGNLYTLALKRDGTLWQWGSMVTNQFENQALPNRLLDNVIAIAAGDEHGLALQRDGTVWSWGMNESGELGDGTTVNQPRPGLVPGLPGVRLIAASSSSNYAVKADGTVMAWGSNERGQLGDGTLVKRVGPIVVPGLTEVTDIAAGDSHVLVKKRDGSVWGWSWDYAAYGELGTLGADAGSIPAPLVGLGDISQIAAGAKVSAFVRSDGQVLMGGENYIGQLGDGTFAARSSLGLVVNANANGFLNLGSITNVKVEALLSVPFYVTSIGGITDNRGSVATVTKFNPADTGKTGAIYITASVPKGSSLVKNEERAIAANSPRLSAAAAAATDAFSLIQLTTGGWQTVTNGQLLPYASGVLGDQLAAQTILDNTDTSTLKGAEFCVGYGSSAQDMLNQGNIRAVATVPGGSTSTSCVVGGTVSVALSAAPGWNLLGNPVNQRIAVAAWFGDAAKVNSVWKWNNVAVNWQFYAPNLSVTELQSYATSQGFAVLNDIEAGDGFWVNAKVQADFGSVTGSAINLRESSLGGGWNLVTTATPISARDFNASLSTTPPTTAQVPNNMTSMWAWDNAKATWYFYAPSLDGQGGSVLRDFVSKHGYYDFVSDGKILSKGLGFWVNRP